MFPIKQAGPKAEPDPQTAMAKGADPDMMQDGTDPDQDAGGPDEQMQALQMILGQIAQMLQLALQITGGSAGDEDQGEPVDEEAPDQGAPPAG